MTAFIRYIGIDYSGAKTPSAGLRGLRVYLAEQDTSPVEVVPLGGKRKYWSRRGVAEWLVELLSECTPTLVGIDHAFSFPLRYFETHCIKPDWPTFLDDFSNIGRPGTITSLPISCVRLLLGQAQRAPVVRAGESYGGARWWSKVGISFRRSGLSSKVHPCRNPWLALSTTPWCTCSLLAVRRLGNPNWLLCHC